MIAPARLTPEQTAWNRRWGAPHGSRLSRAAAHFPQLRRPLEQTIFRAAPRTRGMFAFQPNNTTRAFEYPWAYNAVAPAPGLRVVEIGGSLSGFQFVLERCGANVINVDPGEAAHGRGWPVDEHSIARLNRMFGTNIELRNTFLQNADIPDAHADRVVSVSTIEHIPETELPDVMAHVARILKPGGLFIATVDLFLNIRPFTSRTSNEYGANISAADLIEPHGLELVAGDRAELLGYPEFSADAVLANLENYLLGTYPALIQTVIARKPG